MEGALHWCLQDSQAAEPGQKAEVLSSFPGTESLWQLLVQCDLDQDGYFLSLWNDPPYMPDI